MKFNCYSVKFNCYSVRCSHRIANKFVYKKEVAKLRVGVNMEMCPSWLNCKILLIGFKQQTAFPAKIAIFLKSEIQ